MWSQFLTSVLVVSITLFKILNMDLVDLTDLVVFVDLTDLTDTINSVDFMSLVDLPEGPRTWQPVLPAASCGSSPTHMAASPSRSPSSRAGGLKGLIGCSDSPLRLTSPPRGGRSPVKEGVTGGRHAKRAGVVACVKLSEFFAQSEALEARTPRPRTPDAWDKTISKRQWEIEMCIWRREIRRRALSRGRDPEHICSGDKCRPLGTTPRLSHRPALLAPR